MITVVVLIGALAAQTVDAATTLVGRWDAEARSNGGLGIWIELARDGACSETTGAMVDGTWKLNGDHLTISIPVPGGKTESQETTIAIQGDALVQAIGGQTRRLQRAAAATSSDLPVVGVWTYEHPAGGHGYDEYIADQRFLLRLPMTSKRCRWAAAGDRLRITADGAVQETRWHVAGDRLTLDDGQTSRTYHRERAGVIPPAQGR